ncbi:competence protein ComEC [Pseudomonas aeruginosa VRFPA09]|nr:competence protein ComEC [Pseudomonas aeruginosa VRFPA09]
MRLGLPALAAGLLALRFLAELPSVGWLLGMAAAGLLLLFGRLYWLGLFLLGFAWACGSAQVALDGRLIAELDGRTLWLEGRVVDLPASGEGVTRFRLEEVSAARGVLLPERLRLSWRGAPPLMGGERWRLAVTLKRPRGLVNAAGFDYEAWLLAQRVGAVGTVKAGERLQPASGLDMLGALCWLAPAGLPLRALGAALLLPALLPSSPPVEWGRAEVRVLDVGQGLAVLVRTREHALLYDSGARQGAFDMGERVVVPVLRSLDLRRLDGLLLSHADNDHAGGAPTVASRFPPGWLVSGEPARLPSPLFADSCDERSWSWDGVVFEQWAWAQAGDSNDRSCVLRVEADGEVLLLTGDISRAAEHAWLARQADPRVDWLLAPHHGSRSSSGVAFVLRTRPRHVLVSRGWRNAFGHPHGEVMERYARVAAQVHDTARDGALTFLLGSRGGARRERDSAHFWREK